MPSTYSKLCSAHFSEDQIDRTSLSCVRLREKAVPNIFSAFPSYFQKVHRTRKSPVRYKVTNKKEMGLMKTTTNNEVCSEEISSVTEISPKKAALKRKLLKTNALNEKYRKKIDS